MSQNIVEHPDDKERTKLINDIASEVVIGLITPLQEIVKKTVKAEMNQCRCEANELQAIRNNLLIVRFGRVHISLTIIGAYLLILIKAIMDLTKN